MTTPPALTPERLLEECRALLGDLSQQFAMLREHGVHIWPNHPLNPERRIAAMVMLIREQLAAGEKPSPPPVEAKCEAKVCATCAGSGKIRMKASTNAPWKKIDCPLCSGTGEREVTPPTPPAREIVEKLDRDEVLAGLRRLSAKDDLGHQLPLSGRDMNDIDRAIHYITAREANSDDLRDYIRSAYVAAFRAGAYDEREKPSEHNDEALWAVAEGRAIAYVDARARRIAELATSILTPQLREAMNRAAGRCRDTAHWWQDNADGHSNWREMYDSWMCDASALEAAAANLPKE